MTERVLSWFDPLFERVSKWRILRRAAFIWVLALTATVFEWAMTTDKGAGVIAAVTGPLAALQGAVFGLYSASRDREDHA